MSEWFKTNFLLLAFVAGSFLAPTSNAEGTQSIPDGSEAAFIKCDYTGTTIFPRGTNGFSGNPYSYHSQIYFRVESNALFSLRSNGWGEVSGATVTSTQIELNQRPGAIKDLLKFAVGGNRQGGDGFLFPELSDSSTRIRIVISRVTGQFRGLATGETDNGAVTHEVNGRCVRSSDPLTEGRAF